MAAYPTTKRYSTRFELSDFKNSLKSLASRSSTGRDNQYAIASSGSVNPSSDAVPIALVYRRIEISQILCGSVGSTVIILAVTVKELRQRRGWAEA
jgi:hypothetical protein